MYYGTFCLKIPLEIDFDELYVAGRYFTKYCKEKSQEMGIGGWVKNSKRGTIVGKLQGTKPNVEEM